MGDNGQPAKGEIASIHAYCLAKRSEVVAEYIGAPGLTFKNKIEKLECSVEQLKDALNNKVRDLFSFIGASFLVGGLGLFLYFLLTWIGKLAKK